MENTGVAGLFKWALSSDRWKDEAPERKELVNINGSRTGARLPSPGYKRHYPEIAAYSLTMGVLSACIPPQGFWEGYCPPGSIQLGAKFGVFTWTPHLSSVMH